MANPAGKRSLSDSTGAPQILGWGGLLWKLVGDASNIDFIMSIQAAGLRQAIQFVYDYGIWAVSLLGFVWWGAIYFNKVRRPSWTQTVVAVSLMAFMWGFLTALNAMSSVPRIISTWSNDPAGCVVTILSDRLQKFKNSYDVAFMCGISDRAIDRFTDTRIAISRKFTITPKPFPAFAPYTEKIKTAFPDNPRTPTSLWFMAILVPKEKEITIFNSLADVKKHGGKIFGGRLL